jgi:hypothetical protein
VASGINAPVAPISTPPFASHMGKVQPSCASLTLPVQSSPVSRRIMGELHHLSFRHAG